MSAEALEAFAGALQAALRAASLYPPRHPAIDAPLRRGFGILERLLADGRERVLGVLDDVLVVDELPFFETGSRWAGLFAALRGRGLESVTLRPGLSLEEFRAIARILAGTDEEPVETLWKRFGVVHASFRLLETGEPFRARARRTYERALGVVVDLLAEARAGQIPSSHEALRIVEDLERIALEDPDAVLGLALLRAHDDYTFAHSVHVGLFALAYGHRAELDAPALRAFGLAGLLHDLGKVRTDPAIIRKPGALDEAEMARMRLHPELGAEILASMRGIPEEAVAIVLQHHVRFDRTGYPRLPAGAELHPLADAIGLCDAYDALTTTRPYQRARHPGDAARILRRLAGRAFAPEAVERFLALIGAYPVGETVRLATGELAVVVAQHPVDPTRPVVRLVRAADGTPLDPPPRVELADPSEAPRRIVAPVDPSIRAIDVAAVLDLEFAGGASPVEAADADGA